MEILTVIIIVVVLFIKWRATKRRNKVIQSDKNVIKHFSKVHFTGETIDGHKFLYCPVGNICSWSVGDYEHKWCEWCKKGFEEIAGEISLCNSCNCMTKTVGNKCGKCKEIKR